MEHDEVAEGVEESSSDHASSDLNDEARTEAGAPGDDELGPAPEAIDDEDERDEDEDGDFAGTTAATDEEPDEAVSGNGEPSTTGAEAVDPDASADAGSEDGNEASAPKRAARPKRARTAKAATAKKAGGRATPKAAPKAARKAATGKKSGRGAGGKQGRSAEGGTEAGSVTRIADAAPTTPSSRRAPARAPEVETEQEEEAQIRVPAPSRRVRSARDLDSIPDDYD